MTDEAGLSADLASRLCSGDIERRLGAMAELVGRAAPPGEGELDALVACLDDDRKVIQRRAAEALAILQQRGAEVLVRLRSLRTRPTWRARWGAVYALSLLDSLEPDGIDTLVESLDLADRDVRWAAVDLLKRLARRHRDAVVERMIALAGEGTLLQRRMAFYFLRDLAAGEPAARAAAIDALGTSDSNLRLAALAALAAGSESIEEANRLAALLADPDLRLARAAAATLGSLSRAPVPVLEALRAARLHADPTLRRAAESALRKLQSAGSAD